MFYPIFELFYPILELTPVMVFAGTIKGQIFMFLDDGSGNKSVIFVAVIKEETDVEKLASKVLQVMKLVENSDTKPDPDDREVN